MKYNEVIEERAETANFMQGGKKYGQTEKEYRLDGNGSLSGDARF